MFALPGSLLALNLLGAAALPQEAAAADSALWHAVGELSFTDVAGNRSLSLLSSKLTVSREDPEHLDLTASVGVRYGRSEGELAVADYNASTEARLRPSQPVSPFLSLAANRDDVRNLNIRVSVAAGADVNLVRDTVAQVAVGLALLQDYESIDRIPGSTEPASRSLTRFSARARAEFPLREGVVLRHQSMFQPVVQELDDYLLTTETGVAVLLSDRLSLQTNFKFNRDATPPEGVLFRNDRTLTVGLIVNLR